MLEVRNVSCGYGNQTIVYDASFTLQSGEVLCLLGPNGVGKTTLFKAVLGFLPLTKGEVYVSGQDARRINRRKKAKLIGYVPQVHEPPFPFEVLDVVVMGEVGRLGPFASPSKSHYQRAEEILVDLAVPHLSQRIYTEVSGGERQMVLIARALMQEPQFLVMDEPTSNLDFGNQLRVLEQIERLAERGMGIIMTSHFPDHAFLSCTKAALMSKHQPFRVGPVEEIITETSLAEAYGVQVRIASFTDPEGGTVKTCLPRLHNTGSGQQPKQAITRMASS